MPSSSEPSRARSIGFTLLEILVVVFIIAITAAAAVLAVGTTGRDRELERESERVLGLLNYTREQAEMRTRELGVLFEETRYRFVSFDLRKQIWVEIESDPAMRLRELPDGLSLSLEVEARPVILRRPPDSEDMTPQLMLYSNGDLTPFVLRVRRDEASRIVEVSTNEKGLIEAKPLEERRT
jgi:general secretion pathway protein H